MLKRETPGLSVKKIAYRLIVRIGDGAPPIIRMADSTSRTMTAKGPGRLGTWEAPQHTAQ